MTEETEQKLKKSKLVLAFSILAFLLGLIALLIGGFSTFGLRFLGRLEVLAPFSSLFILGKMVSYGMEAFALIFGLAAVIIAFLKKMRKAFALISVALILAAVGITAAGTGIQPPKTMPKNDLYLEKALEMTPPGVHEQILDAMKNESMRAGQSESDLYPKEFMDMIKHKSTIKATPTPLMKAAEAGRTEEVRALLKEGANPNERSVMRLSACGLAVKNGNVETFKVFLEDAAFESDKENLGDLLRVAIDNNQMEMVSLLIAHDADLNKQDLDADDWTPLMYAAYNGNKAAADVLIEHGAGIDRRNAGGGTALMLAASMGQERIVGMLLNHGADANAKTVDGHTPLISACDGGSLESVKLLLSHGADINQCDSYGRSPMQWAAQRGHIDLVRYLQQNGARK
jgi:ankyrin repeat protein